MLFYFACEAAGASRARHSLRPLIFQVANLQAQLARAPAARSRTCKLSLSGLRHASASPESIITIGHNGFWACASGTSLQRRERHCEPKRSNPGLRNGVITGLLLKSLR